jgi:hypothetical protein
MGAWPRRWSFLVLIWVLGAATGSFLAPTLAAFSSTSANPGNTFHAAPSFTPQHIKEIGSVLCGGTSSVITVPAGGVAAGNTVIVRLVIRGSGSGSVTALDSRGNSYTNDVDFTGNSVRVVVLSASAGTALAQNDTITVSHPTGDATGAVASEFFGVVSSGRVDDTGTATGNNATPSAAVITVQPRDLLVGVVGNTNSHSYTEAANWTTLSHLSMSCGGAPGNANSHSARRSTATAGSYSYSPTLNSGDRWAAAIVAYKPQF